MSDELQFISGLIFKGPNKNAPNYIKCKVSIHRDELIQWLQEQQTEWVNADVKVSKSGKWYATVDNWKPTVNSNPSYKKEDYQKPMREEIDDDIPF